VKEKNILTQSSYLIPKSDESIKVFCKNLPKKPGVYKFLDKDEIPIYIGKAKFLNKRLISYFRKSSKTKKIERLMQEAISLELALTNTELESLLLEQYLIKEFRPKFNVQFKDDKGYPWIKINSHEEFPSAKSFLGKNLENGNFFGPFPNSYAVRDALKLIQKTFKLRNCSQSYFKNRSRPCLQYEIGRCSAPCIDLINKEEYMKDVRGAELLLEGKSQELINGFYSSMDKLSKNKDYEKAAIYRDRISALRDIQRSQSIAGFSANRDAIYISILKNSIKIGVTSVNQGWVTGHRNFIYSDNGSLEEQDILETFITQRYLSSDECPAALVINSNIKNKKLLESALFTKFSKRISIITKPGKKDRGLLDVCKTNTEYVFQKNRIDKDIEYKLMKLKSGLQLKHDISSIESYDISHHAGKNAVAGCVVYSVEGKARNLYRTYNISKVNSGNDIGSMGELIERRFGNIDEKNLPSLIIIDGGKTHLKQILRKFDELKIKDINIISISKGVRRKSSFDQIHLSNDKSFFVENGSTFHNFIQEIRDETHRYAISSQQKKMKKSSMKSSIDDIKGVGMVRRKLLLRYFGSLEQMKRASIEDISEVSGIGKNTAKSIYNALHD